MKCTLFSFSILWTVLTFTSLCRAECHTIFIPQSSGEDIVKDIILAPFQASPEKDCFSFGFTSFVGYDQSFLGNRIANDLFGNYLLNFVGSQRLQEHRWKGTVLIADNFGISPQAQQMITLDPTIKRVTARFQLHFGFGEWAPGLWLKIVLPFEYTRWKLGLSQSNIERTLDTIPFNGGCMNLNTAQQVTPAPTLQKALSGDFIFGNMTNPWKAGRFSFETHDKSELADIHLYAGYDFINRRNYHIALYMLGVVPTGSHPHPYTVFTPIVGNGHFGELGIGLSAHAHCYTTDQWGLSIHTAGHISHAFKSYQPRLFDLKNGCLSRYLLMKEFIQRDNSTTVSSLMPGVNILLRSASVYVPLKGEFAFEVRYEDDRNICAGLGYAFYGKAAEKIGNIRPLDMTVGIKGCAPYASACYATETVNNNQVISDEPATFEPLLSTQSNSTISQCGTVDNPIVASTSDPSVVCIDTCSNTTAITSGTLVASLPRAMTSNPPRFIDDTQLDIPSATAGKQMSHKIFFHIDYTFNEKSWKPFLSFGAHLQASSAHYSSTLNQWGIWLQAGLLL